MQIRLHRPPFPLILLLVLTAVAFLMRIWQLDTLPPGLWWDEAGNGLDAREMLEGQIHIYFPRSHGKEPLFVYLLIPFVAWWGSSPLAIRLLAALLGTLMVPALYFLGRALWQEQPRSPLGIWVGLSAAALWAFNYWPQTINRLGFRVNTLPLFLTLALIAWLRWHYRPSRQRAISFGILAALTLMTYLASRITLLLWPLLYLTLPAERRRRLHATLPWACLAFLVVISPLALYFATHPAALFDRVSTFDVAQAGTPLLERLPLLKDSTRLVIGTFLSGEGDPVLRHNLPYRPAFAPYLALLFLIGTGMALYAAVRRREQAGRTLLLCWGLLCLPSVLSASSNPHFVRLFGALPPALVLAAWPLAWLATRPASTRPWLRPAGATLLLLLLLVEGGRTAQDYFVSWASRPDLYDAFQGELLALGESLQQQSNAQAVMAIPPALEPAYRDYVLAYRYPALQERLHPIVMEESRLAASLADTLAGHGGGEMIVPLWEQGLYVTVDPLGRLPFYLLREGSIEQRDARRGVELLHIRLAPQPQFTTEGQRQRIEQPFPPALTLVEAEWGAAHPNPARDSDKVAAGTPLWAILTWRGDEPAADLRVTLELVDVQGHRIATTEQAVTGTLGPGALWRSHHLLPLPATQPPGPLFLESRVYHAPSMAALQPSTRTARGSVAIGTLQALPALVTVDATTLPLARPLHVPFPSGVTLLGMEAWPEQVGPGQPLALRLYWQIEERASTERPFTLSLAGSERGTTFTLSPEIPTGHIVHTLVDLPVPANAAPGSTTLLLHGADSASPLVIGSVEVAGRVRQFEPPTLARALTGRFGEVVTLVGMDAPPTIEARAGESIELPLAWQVLQPPDAPLVRFAHLLDGEGRLVAQEDTIPCAGECPASSWLPQEFLVERARLTLPDPAVEGSYTVVVGWYRADTLERLAATGEHGSALPNNAAALPLTIRVVP